MLNSLVSKDRMIGRHVNMPEGAIVNSANKVEMILTRKLGARKLDQSIIDDIEEIYHKTDSSIDNKVIKSIKRSLEPQILEKGIVTKPINEQNEYHYVDSQKLNFRKNVEGFNSLLNSSQWKEELESYFGAGFKFEHAASGWSDSVTESEEDYVTTAWHLDKYFRTSKTRCFVFLSDESSRKAPLQIVDRSETKKLMSKYSIDYIRNNPDVVEEEADIHEFSGSAGDFIIFNPATHLHRATNPTEGDYRRKTLMVDFVPVLDIF